MQQAASTSLHVPNGEQHACTPRHTVPAPAGTPPKGSCAQLASAIVQKFSDPNGVLIELQQAEQADVPMQSESAQSTKPSQSLSIPSVQFSPAPG